MTTLTARPSRSGPLLLPRILLAVAGGVLLFLAGALAWTGAYRMWYAGRIYPGVSVAGVDLSNLPPEQAALTLSQALGYANSGRIVFRDGASLWVATPAELGLVFDPIASAMSAYQVGRGPGGLAAQLRLVRDGVPVPPAVVFDQRIAYQYLQALAAQIDRPVIEAALAVQGTNVFAQPGQIGRNLNVDLTMAALTAQLATFTDGEVALVVEERAPRLLDVSAQEQIARALLSAPLVLTLPDAAAGDPGPWTIPVPTLADWLDVGLTADGAGLQVQLDRLELQSLLADIAGKIDRQPENARFRFNDTSLQIELIRPSVTGRLLDIAGSLAAVDAAVEAGAHSLVLTVDLAPPQVGDLATGQELGILEKVSDQTTYFWGSSPARIQNIQTAAAQFDGLLIAPGETFSMGAVLGDVSLDNGYAEAMIIYNGQTIKGVGGGVCQVSTTLFRTAFFGGYPILERSAHAYRVPYYEQNRGGSVDPRWAGMDATVFFPLVDFVFQNDSPYWLLMETYVYVNSRAINWRFYSTSDGRTVDWTSTGPTNVVPAPTPRFELNTNLNLGEMKQIDYSADGSDVVVTRTVSRGGQVIQSDTFRTHYEPWQAICEFGPGVELVTQLAAELGLCQQR